MNKTYSAFLLAAVVSSSSAFAADGIINFTGEITDLTCKIDGSDGYVSKTVVLPAVSTSSMPAGGNTAGLTPFALQLTECDGASAQVYFEPEAAHVDMTSGYLINKAASGSNVNVQLLNNQQQAINILGGLSGQNSQTVNIQGNSATMSYFAQYIAPSGSGATPGAVQAAVQFSMIYQ